MGSLSVSDRAWQRILQINKAERVPLDRPLRLAVVPGGCNGHKYEFTFERAENIADDDILMTKTAAELEATIASPEKLQVAVDAKSLSKIEGAVLDFQVELAGSAFQVIGNMLVDEQCACKQSFGMKRLAAKRATTEEATAPKPTAEPATQPHTGSKEIIRQRRT